MSYFIGRQAEIATLKGLQERRSASLVVISGRRRIGKSRLLLEYGQYFQRVYTFSGLAPTKDVTAATQRGEFVRQLARAFNLPGLAADDWGDLFWHLSQQVMQGQVLIVLDEITWMGDKDSTFLGKLKNAWDLYFKQNDQLVLALSGSLSSWIEKNILSSTGFLGRPSLAMHLDELPLKDCLQFWGGDHQGISCYEKLKVIGMTGGVPRYLEQVQPQLTAEENIKQLCFKKSGILVTEFENVFSDLFSKRSILYQQIVESLADGPADRKMLCSRIGLSVEGNISEYLDDLVQSGFISRDYTWHVKSGLYSKLSQYRLKDNYSRFYLKYIKPNKVNIEKGSFYDISIAELKGWNTMMGLQFENTVLANRGLIFDALKIEHSDVICDNPFFQTATATRKGCQIDYLIQTKFNNLYVCEMKYSKNRIGSEVIQQMQEKIKRLAIPKNFSYRCILIHVNGISDAVEDSPIFSKIIDFGKLAML